MQSTTSLNLNLRQESLIWSRLVLFGELFYCTGPVLTTLGKFENATLFLRLRLPFTLVRQLTFYLFLFLPSQELRVELDKLLKQKIAQPEMKLSVGTGVGNKESALLRAIIDLITSEESTNWVRDWIDNRYLCH